MNIYDISSLAGVSVTTVSRVLNADPNVSVETQERVNEVIQKYGYVPKQRVRNFTRNQLQAIGLLMDDIRNPYMAELAYAINQELTKWKVSTILCDMVDVQREFINQVDNLISKRVNGIILMSSIFDNDVCRVAIERRYSGFPFISINARFELPNVYQIMQDQEQGTRDAVRHLYQTGKRALGMIYYHQTASDRRKKQGFLAGMKDCGLAPERMLEVSQKTLAEGQKMTRAFMEAFPDADGIVYSADILAVGGVHYFNQAGLQIPQEIAVVGFNNSRSAQECYPPMTSVDNQLFLTGTTAAQMMLSVLNHQPVEDTPISCGLAIRESTV